MQADLLTILTPTYNRSQFLHRMLRFLRATQFPFRAIIVDSSDPQEQQRNEWLFQQFSEELSLEYVCASSSLIRKCTPILKELSSPYVAFLADDDFLFWRKLVDFVQYLERNPSCATVQGRVINATDMSSDGSGYIACRSMQMRDILAGSPIDRLVEYVERPFSTFYGVHRTDLLARAFRVTDESTDYDASRGFPEAMLLLLAPLYGKIKTIDEVHYLQVDHKTTCTRTVPKIAQSHRESEFVCRFCDGLIRELLDCASIDIDAAASLAEDVLHVVPGLRRRKRRRKRTIVGTVVRELRRNFEKSRRVAEKVMPSPKGPYVKSRDLLPGTADYDMALQMLVEFPNGIPVFLEKFRRAA